MRKLFSVMLMAVMLLTVFLPAQISNAATITETPTGVAGRVLTTDKSGDNAEWIEIAKNGDYSLIVRKEVIKSSAFSDKYGIYSSSTARTNVNTWYNSTLGSQARLRDFAVQNNATSQLGVWSNINDGFSKPTTTIARTGNDVAFLLSFAEAAKFCSTQYATSNGASYTQSPALAVTNFNKLGALPLGQPESHWWLRTQGSPADRACTVGTGGSNTWGTDTMKGAVNQYQVTSNVIKIRPALWVDSNIFENQYKITYDPNGGAGTVKTISAIANTNYTIANQGYTRSNYVFDGWNTNAAGTGTSYTNGAQMKVTGNVTLYAQWKSDQINITYHTNVGGVESITDKKPKGSNYTTKTFRETTLTQHKGLTFWYWNTEPDGSGTIYRAYDEFILSDDLDLYVIWLIVD